MEQQGTLLRRMGICVVCFVAAAWIPQAAAQSIQDVQTGIDWLKAQDCPTLTEPLQIKSLLNEDVRSRILVENVSLVEQGASAVSAASATKQEQANRLRSQNIKPSRKLQQQFRQLDEDISAKSLHSSAAAFQWAQAMWIEMALVNPVYPPSSSNEHPLLPLSRQQKRMQSAVSSFNGGGPAAELMQPVPGLVGKCLISVQNQIADYNSLLFSSAIKDAATPQAVRSVLKKYAIHSTNFQASGISPAPIVQTAYDRIAWLEDEIAQEKARLAKIEAERRAAEQARLAEERRRQCEAGAQAAKPLLQVAQRFVSAVNNKNINAATATLHQNVVISSPSRSGGRNTSTGISAARSRLLDGFNDNSGGSTRNPTMNGCGSISASMMTSQGRATMSFSFEQGKISRISVQQ